LTSSTQTEPAPTQPKAAEPPGPDKTGQDLEVARAFAALAELPDLPLGIRRKVTGRQALFCRAWAVSGSEPVAAMVAGYTGTSVYKTAKRLLGEPGCIEAITWCLEQLDPSKPAAILSRLNELHKISTASVPVLDRKGKPTGYYKVDGPTAARCLELMGKHAGMFDQRVTVTHKSEIHLLLEQVAARGKPALEHRHRQVIDGQAERIPATQQDVKR